MEIKPHYVYALCCPITMMILQMFATKQQAQIYEHEMIHKHRKTILNHKREVKSAEKFIKLAKNNV